MGIVKQALQSLHKKLIKRSVKNKNGIFKINKLPNNYAYTLAEQKSN